MEIKKEIIGKRYLLDRDAIISWYNKNDIEKYLLDILNHKELMTEFFVRFEKREIHRFQIEISHAVFELEIEITHFEEIDEVVRPIGAINMINIGAVDNDGDARKDIFMIIKDYSWIKEK
jgi:hypothetical protein